jgi:hypothetical protein
LQSSGNLCFKAIHSFFRIYHAYAEIDTYRERKQSVLSGIWLVKVVGWLEANVVPGKLENVLEVPFFPGLCERLRGQTNQDQPQTIVSEY